MMRRQSEDKRRETNMKEREDKERRCKMMTQRDEMRQGEDKKGDTRRERQMRGEIMRRMIDQDWSNKKIRDKEMR